MTEDTKQMVERIHQAQEQAKAAYRDERVREGQQNREALVKRGSLYRNRGDRHR